MIAYCFHPGLDICIGFVIGHCFTSWQAIQVLLGAKSVYSLAFSCVVLSSMTVSL